MKPIHSEVRPNHASPRRTPPAAAFPCCMACCLALSASALAEQTDTDHSQHMGMDHSSHAAMDHSMMDHAKMQHASMDHSAHGMANGQADHAAHMAMMDAGTEYLRTVDQYDIPDMQLTDANGDTINIRTLLAEERPVIMNFIFTSCTTVCPILTATLSQASQSLTSNDVEPLLVSISIDPDYDTPNRLRDYAKRYHAGDNWHFLTGSPDQIVALQRAFGAYYGNKLNHKPVSFLRKTPQEDWVRLQGFTTSADLVYEYRALFDSHG